MITNIKVDFGNDKKITAEINDFAITTDQPKQYGGNAENPSPYDLFLASLATCAANYARKFCDSKSIDAKDLDIAVEYELDNTSLHIDKVRFHLSLPADFPEKHKAALLRSIDLCPIKRTLMCPPAFELEMD